MKKKFGIFHGGGGSGPIQNFFFVFFGFFLKAMGKHWKWSDSSRNAKKKISLLWGGWYPVLYGTVLYKIVQYTVKIWSANFFSSISGWIRTYSFVSTPCPKKKAFVFVSLLSTSNLAQNSCPGTVLKSAGTQLSNAPPEI